MLLHGSRVLRCVRGPQIIASILRAADSTRAKAWRSGRFGDERESRIGHRDRRPPDFPAIEKC